jgi:hypothetical protein
MDEETKKLLERIAVATESIDKKIAGIDEKIDTEGYIFQQLSQIMAGIEDLVACTEKKGNSNKILNVKIQKEEY